MLQEYGLTQDPFPIVPDGPVHNWAGRAELREDLIDLIKGVRARDIGVTEFAIIWGEYGTGKSHALRYLRTLIEEDTQDFNSLAIYVPRPRVAAKLNFLELYKYVVTALGRARLERYCRRMWDIFNGTVQEKIVSSGLEIRDPTSFYEPALQEFSGHDRDMVRLLVRGSTDFEAVYQFFLGARGCQEYEGKVDSDFMAAKVLGDLFRTLTSDMPGESRVLESVYLFIDEAEMLIEAKAAESELVFAGLRELINELPYRFCLILSFSAATALIEAVMPTHLLKRMTRPYIEVGMLGDRDAVEFLRAQLDFFRPKESKYMGTFHPFSNEAIEFIVSSMIDLTPRNLFIDCKRVLERSIRRFNLAPGEEITRDMAERILVAYR